MEQAISHLPSIQGGNINAIVDASLDIGYNPESVQKIAELAVRCGGPQAALRPSISEVLREIQVAIQMELQLEEPNNQQLLAVDDEIPEEYHVNANQAFDEVIDEAIDEANQS
jgi:hypothetical protein